MNSPLKMALQEAGYNRYNYLMENISILNEVYDKKIKPMGKDGWVSVCDVGNIGGDVKKFQTESWIWLYFLTNLKISLFTALFAYFVM